MLSLQDKGLGRAGFLEFSSAIIYIECTGHLGDRFDPKGHLNGYRGKRWEELETNVHVQCVLFRSSRYTNALLRSLPGFAQCRKTGGVAEKG